MTNCRTASAVNFPAVARHFLTRTIARSVAGVSVTISGRDSTREAFNCSDSSSSSCISNAVFCNADSVHGYLDAHYQWEDDLSQDDLCSQVQMMDYCRRRLTRAQMIDLQAQIDAKVSIAKSKTA